ncbi:cytochrome d ubiquinol oxidase subunit II [soil metagenome]
MDLNTIWFFLIGVLLIGYAVLDGFDLGVGIIHLFFKTDEHRRLSLNSIGPVWDGNEVWLITSGGALFAAFPNVYATAFSGFYLPFMVLLFALISRAVSIEFRSKEKDPRWRNSFDIAFSAGSFLSSLLFGVAVGNIIAGMKIGSNMEYQGTLLDQLNPYALLMGVFTVIVFAMHGAIYLNLKNEGAHQDIVRGLAKKLYYLFVVFFVIVTAVTLWKRTGMLANFSFGKIPSDSFKHDIINQNEFAISVFAWFIVLLNILAIANIPRTLQKGKELQCLISSGCSIGAMIFLFAAGLFPDMMPSTIDPQFSLNIYNASSSLMTLKNMLIIALIGLPFVLSYTISIYWVFRGKTKINKHSY